MTRDDAVRRLASGQPVLVSQACVADHITPVAACDILLGDDKPGLLLESVLGGERRGRYSLIGLEPDAWFSIRHGKAYYHELGQDEIALDEPPMQALRSLLARDHIDITDDLPVMSAGWVGYLGYDMVGLVEELPRTNPDALDIPDVKLMRPTVMVVFDAVDGVVRCVTPVRPNAAVDAESLWNDAQARLDDVVQRLATPVAVPPVMPIAPEADAEVRPNMSREQFHSMVDAAKDYIKAGDIFQVVLSQRFERDFDLPPFSFYRALRYLNPSPFLFYLNLDGFQLIGSSPEILVRLRDDTVTIRPIAGTRPRGKNEAQDMALEQELLADPKEIAEHLMLLDLGRNDVGRVSQGGTVRVTEEMVIERYSHVMHIVSNVEGTIREGADALDALMAGFPAGTVSGAPKIRAMEIIDELEPQQRSFYAGCVGYFAADGSMDSCITLRTAMIKDGKLYAQAGGGVVADSTAEGEYQESWNKARAVLKAADLAEAFA